MTQPSASTSAPAESRTLITGERPPLPGTITAADWAKMRQSARARAAVRKAQFTATLAEIGRQAAGKAEGKR